MTPALSCDVFCRVVDNFGDVGVCWRLARQLHSEKHYSVRLFIDDLASLARLVPTAVGYGVHQGIEVAPWPDNETAASLVPASLVIEAFACELPSAYVANMAASPHSPAGHCWVNLEYLSAEEWVESHHLLPSVHPQLGLTKTFFFPGFTARTGGLLREAGLGRSAATDTGRVLLFGYPNAAASALVQAMRASGLAVDVPTGALAAALRGEDAEVNVREFVPFDQFDALLGDYDVAFVRGEDSFVRTQWAGKPFVWQIYPQDDGVHEEKLAAFVRRYCEGMAPELVRATEALWWAWNRHEASAIGTAWANFWERRAELRAHAVQWRESLLAQTDLCTQLVTFHQKAVKI